MFFVFCDSHAFASVQYCLVVNCLEKADHHLALVGNVYCIFVTFPCGILGHVWCLIVSFPDLCILSYFDKLLSFHATQKKKQVLLFENAFSNNDWRTFSLFKLFTLQKQM